LVSEPQLEERIVMLDHILQSRKAAVMIEVRAQYPGFKVLSYSPEYKNIQIEDGLACERFEGEAKFKMSPEGPPDSWHGKGLRVMRRQSDGSWKFALVGLK
jgi:hypothetical protein